MKVSSAVRKETCHIAVGVLVGTLLMVAVFALLKRLDYTVLLGALLGGTGAVGNFYFMGKAAQKAMDDPDRASLIMRGSYSRRMLGMVAIMILGFLVPWFQPVAVLIPFLFPSITIKLMQLLGMYKPQQKGGGQVQ